jgi:hypothetical protein
MIMKQILGVHGKTPNLAIHAELGLEPPILVNHMHNPWTVQSLIIRQL